MENAFITLIKSYTYGELTRIEYDREERSRLAVEQGRFAQEHFIEPHRGTLELWSAQFSARELELQEARA